MKNSFSFFKSRFGRRILFLFLLCAFVPTVLLIGFSYQRVRDQMYEQTWLRMDKECKTYAMGLMDRLIHMDYLVRLSTPTLVSGQRLAQLPAFQFKQLQETFAGLGTYGPETGLQVRYGDLGQAMRIANVFSPFLQQSDKSTLYLDSSNPLDKTLYLLVPFEHGGRRGLVVARPATPILWGLGAYSLLPAYSELAVYDNNGKWIAGTPISPGPDLPPHISRSQSSFIQFEYDAENATYLASGWSLFLASHFNAQTWTIILSLSSSDALSTMNEFRHSFPLLVLLMLWIILFLSLYFIRKTITPLTVINEATQRVGIGDFTQQVEITSGDEFEQLAHSFNAMTNQLQEQLHTLAVIDTIDRSILSSLDSSIIIPRSLRLIAEFFSCPLTMLAQHPRSEPNQLHLTRLTGSHLNDIVKEHASMDEQERTRLYAGQPSIMLSRQSFLPAFLAREVGGDTFLFLPLEADRTVQGALILQLSPEFFDQHPKAASQARQIADQLAIALANARLVSNLEQLSIGAVEALARTVDAKSRWTSGHSERVADLAVKIGRAMHCDDRLLEQLLRGGLLHDIGKIGIPVAILDKPGKLDDQEYVTIQKHPQIGGQILEPIQPYQDVIPMIVQHHERFDGKGYPAGLAGDAICFGARVLCVADVYDALISQRPYRQGWVKEEVLTFMRGNSGIMFDPRVVEAFLSLDV